MAMNKHNQNGFSLIIVVVIVLIVAATGFFVLTKTSSNANNQGDMRNQKSQVVENVEPETLELRNLGLTSFSDVLVSGDALRDYNSQGLKGFYVFGDKLPGNRVNPNFEFSSLKPNTKVVSAIDGVVAFIKQQNGDEDMEVFIQPKEGSAWTIGYDHLTKLAVKKGDSIKAGDLIGEPVLQGNGLPRFEIQINKDENGETTHYCPSSLLAESVKMTQLDQLKVMLQSWEQTSGFDLYDIEAQNPVGCKKLTLSVAEAEGR